MFYKPKASLAHVHIDKHTVAGDEPQAGLHRKGHVLLTQDILSCSQSSVTGGFITEIRANLQEEPGGVCEPKNKGFFVFFRASAMTFRRGVNSQEVSASQ